MRKPAWAMEMKSKYKACVANSFVITGNIGDYVDGRMLFKWYLYNYLIDDMNFARVLEYNISTGTESILGTKPDGDKFADFCSEMISENGPKTAFIITYPEFLIPGNPGYANQQSDIISLHSAMNSDIFLSSDNMVIIVTESVRDIHNMFLSSNSKTAFLEVTLPDEATRKDFIENIFEQEAENKYFKNTKMEIDISTFANMTSGLTLSNIDDIVMTAISRGTLSRDMVIERKKELIKKEFGEIIEILDTDGYGLDKFAGQEHLKEYFRDVVINAVADGDVDIVPKGVLLMGPPGTGKTYFSRCLAADAGINFVEFKMSKILDKWVGESEKRMEKALNVFRALAPVGVFMDEVDQTLGRNADGSGHEVNKNLFGMLLAEMSKPENRGRIIWLGATNYPNNIDEALKRPGRFDKKVPFFAPSYEDRKLVFKIHLKKKNPGDDINYDFLASETDGFTQAEIEGIVLKSVELAHRDRENKDNILKNCYLEKALKFMCSVRNNKIQNMVDIALKEVNDLEFVPADYMEQYKKLQSE